MCCLRRACRSSPPSSRPAIPIAASRSICATAACRCRCARAESLMRPAEIYIADTIGELGLFYKIATIAFIGARWWSTAARTRSRPYARA